MYYSHQSSNFNAEILETPWQDLLFSLPALSQRERKVNKVIKYSIRTRKWNQLDLRLWRESIVFKLPARGGVRGHSLTRPPTVAHMERMLCMPKWFLRLCVCACARACTCERPYGTQGNDSLLSQQQKQGIYWAVQEKNSTSHNLVQFQMSVFGCFQWLKLSSLLEQGRICICALRGFWMKATLKGGAFFLAVSWKHSSHGLKSCTLSGKQRAVLDTTDGFLSVLCMNTSTVTSPPPKKKMKNEKSFTMVLLWKWAEAGSSLARAASHRRGGKKTH